MASLSVTLFTARQQRVLQSTFAGEAIRDKRLLNKLAILGFAKLHKDTGKTVQVSKRVYIKAWYLTAAKPFEVINIGRFHVQYNSGCPYPFIVKTDAVVSSSSATISSPIKTR